MKAYEYKLLIPGMTNRCVTFEYDGATGILSMDGSSFEFFTEAEDYLVGIARQDIESTIERILT